MAIHDDQAGTPHPQREEFLPGRGRQSNSALDALGVITRSVMIIAVLATFVTAVALLIYGAFETWHFVEQLFFDPEHALTHDQVLLHAIEIIDLFLLATVVQVVALGLYQLYFNQDLHLPAWLKINNLDDLKSKLVGVTITVMSVFFLGRALTWTGEIGIIYLGGAVAAVIAALTFFLSRMGDH